MTVQQGPWPLQSRKSSRSATPRGASKLVVRHHGRGQIKTHVFKVSRRVAHEQVAGEPVAFAEDRMDLMGRCAAKTRGRTGAKRVKLRMARSDRLRLPARISPGLPRQV